MTSTKLVVALALLLGATSATLAKSNPHRGPIYNFVTTAPADVNPYSPTLTGGGSLGYNELVAQDM